MNPKITIDNRILKEQSADLLVKKLKESMCSTNALLEQFVQSHKEQLNNVLPSLQEISLLFAESLQPFIEEMQKSSNEILQSMSDSLVYLSHETFSNVKNFLPEESNINSDQTSKRGKIPITFERFCTIISILLTILQFCSSNSQSTEKEFQELNALHQQKNQIEEYKTGLLEEITQLLQTILTEVTSDDQETKIFLEELSESLDNRVESD